MHSLRPTARTPDTNRLNPWYNRGIRNVPLSCNIGPRAQSLYCELNQQCAEDHIVSSSSILALPTYRLCAEQGLCICRASVRPSVCRLLSVCPIRPPHAAAGLLLWARRPGDIDRLLHGKGPAASSSRAAARRTASSATLSAGVRS